jgi:hypothetical protein
LVPFSTPQAITPTILTCPGAKPCALIHRVERQYFRLSFEWPTTRSICYLASCMWNVIQPAILAVFFASLATASSPCPVTLVSGAGEPDAITVTFQNAGKLPIRRLEFNCTLIRAQAHKGQGTLCRDENALFFPGTEYTVRYPYSDSIPRPVEVSLKSVTLSDGYIWKPSKRHFCRTLRIYPRRTKK